MCVFVCAQLWGEAYMQKLRAFWSDDSGVTMIEYGLLAALIAVVCIASVTSIGSQLTRLFKVVYLQLQVADLKMEIAETGS